MTLYFLSPRQTPCQCGHLYNCNQISFGRPIAYTSSILSDCIPTFNRRSVRDQPDSRLLSEIFAAPLHVNQSGVTWLLADVPQVLVRSLLRATNFSALRRDMKIDIRGPGFGI